MSEPVGETPNNNKKIEMRHLFKHIEIVLDVNRVMQILAFM
jgi:hypothetical protein